MRNLLLEQDKKNIHREYLFRLGVVYFLFLFTTVVIGAVFLLPSYFLSETKEASVRERTSIIEQSIAIREQEARSGLLVETKQRLELLSFKRSNSAVTGTIQTIVTHKPAGVSISQFLYTKQREGQSTLTIEGFAKQREDLLAFRKALEQEREFQNVELPISNLAADRDVKFTITIKGIML
jgi:Tfp pilus assembly protein PilN